MEMLKQIVKTEEAYNTIIKLLSEVININKNTDKMYVIDSIQIIIHRITGVFMLYKDCEEIYFAILNN